MTKPVTIFEKNDAMFATELMHEVKHSIEPLLARMMICELGNASLHEPLMDSWYGYAHFNGHKTPFALRMDHNGQTTIGTLLGDVADMTLAVTSILPGIMIEQLPGARAYGNTSFFARD